MNRSFLRFLSGAGLLATAAAHSAIAAPPFAVEEAGIAQIQAAVAGGTLSYAQLTQAYLERIAAYEDGGPRLNAILTLNPKAQAEAAALDAERKRKGARGPLHGIPVLLKDNIDTADMPTSNGSAILRNAIPPDDAYITRALREAGAVILGKAAMGEFAGGSYNSVGGQTLNPYNFKRHTGGSSSGSGAALAANFTVLAVGTDTSTSVRGPSAYNGVVGIRPTTGLISRDGIAPKNLNFDSAGPMARSVSDAAALLSVIAGEDGGADPLNASVWQEMARRYPVKSGHIDWTKYLQAGALKGRKLGVIRDFFGGDPQIDALAEQALAQMRKLGASTVDIHLDAAFLEKYVGEGNRNIRRLSDYRFRQDWEAYLAKFADPTLPKTVAQMVEIYEKEVMKSPLPVEDSVMRLLKASLTTSPEAPEYREFIEKTLPQATQDKLALFSRYGVDALVFPYFASFAPPIRNPAYSIDDPSFVKSEVPQPATLAGYSSVGFPSVVVPMGFGSQGLPMDIGFLGKPYEEGQLIGFAYAYEQATKWRKPSPLLPPLKR
ncbi:amidase [Solimonas aquatica]|uniref:Amidase n=1 Tax=Solimonas aquatica TaxID=489703 RepID=A0A1H8ZUN3_9GAMM|nr:amidase family protein [Solimonas aquatica]SEP67983.1 amidase [Solimonas aquatica]